MCWHSSSEFRKAWNWEEDKSTTELNPASAGVPVLLSGPPGSCSNTSEHGDFTLSNRVIYGGSVRVHHRSGICELRAISNSNIIIAKPWWQATKWHSGSSTPGLWLPRALNCSSSATQPLGFRFICSIRTCPFRHPTSSHWLPHKWSFEQTRLMFRDLAAFLLIFAKWGNSTWLRGKLWEHNESTLDHTDCKLQTYNSNGSDLDTCPPIRPHCWSKCFLITLCRSKKQSSNSS